MGKSANKILVTGASGQLGSELCRLLRAENLPFAGTDLRESENDRAVRICDLSSTEDLRAIFSSEEISVVVHLAGVLPSSFWDEPIRGAEINIGGSVNLLKEAIRAGVRRFVFGSSLSVYGSVSREVDESSAAASDEPYGAAKRLIELVGERLNQTGQIEFAALRIARVIGPGAVSTSSPWRMELLDPQVSRVSLPFAATARIALVHVTEVAKMLLLLVTRRKLQWTIYDTPSEVWDVKALKEIFEQRPNKLLSLGQQVEGGAVCSGARFRDEFHFALQEVLSYSNDEGLAWPRRCQNPS